MMQFVETLKYATTKFRSDYVTSYAENRQTTGHVKRLH